MEDDQIKIFYSKKDIISDLIAAVISVLLFVGMTIISILSDQDIVLKIFMVLITIGAIIFSIFCVVQAIRKILFYVIIKGDTFIIRDEKGKKDEWQLSNIKKVLESRKKICTRRQIDCYSYWFIIVLESDAEIKLHYSLKNLDKLARYLIEKRESGQITRKVLPKGVEKILCKI